MSDPHTHNQKDRSLEKALAHNLIDRYLSHTESWLRAILQMCFFSLVQVDGKSALVVECPNQAVAKRLSCKIWDLCHLLRDLRGREKSGDRIFVCYQDGSQKSWRYYDSQAESWKNLLTPRIRTTKSDS